MPFVSYSTRSIRLYRDLQVKVNFNSHGMGYVLFFLALKKIGEPGSYKPICGPSSHPFYGDIELLWLARRVRS